MKHVTDFSDLEEQVIEIKNVKLPEPEIIEENGTGISRLLKLENILVFFFSITLVIGLVLPYYKMEVNMLGIQDLEYGGRLITGWIGISFLACAIAAIVFTVINFSKGKIVLAIIIFLLLGEQFYKNVLGTVVASALAKVQLLAGFYVTMFSGIALAICLICSFTVFKKKS